MSAVVEPVDPAAPLWGLVLAGGQSTRMGTDKAALTYGGRTQLERACELAALFAERVLVSVRAEQAQDPLRARFDRLLDEPGSGSGPIAGLAAAQRAHPSVAWLVLACDLPFLDAATLDALVKQRRADRYATAYRSSTDGLPEPLCAIWEPRSAAGVRDWIAAGRHCPRKLLVGADVELLDLPSRQALANVNSPEEYQAASTVLKQLRVQYFAVLREQAGRSEERLESTAGTPGALYAELSARYAFHLAPRQMRVAINDDFGDWDSPLRSGDTVVFIPPVAGG